MSEGDRAVPSAVESRTGRGAGVPESRASQATGLGVRRISWVRSLGVSLLYALGAATATWVAHRLARASERADAGGGSGSHGQMPRGEQW